MVNPKQQTLQNQFKLHDIKFTNSSNYLASQLDLNSTPTQLNDILSALKAVASKLENLAEQLSAHMTLDDLEPYLQKSADASILVLHYADKISSRQLKDNDSHRSHLSDSVPSSHRHLAEEEPTRRPTTATDYANQQDLCPSTSHPNPNANILDMTTEQLSRHLAQSSDRITLGASGPSLGHFNIEMNDTPQVRQRLPEQPYTDDYHRTLAPLPTQHATILSANSAQPPQPSTTVDPYYNRGHIAYTNNYHRHPSNPTMPGTSTLQNHSLHVPDANQHFSPEQSNLISSQLFISVPFVQPFSPPQDLVEPVSHPSQIAQASLHSVNANRPTAPSPYTPATTSFAFPEQPNSNIYTTAQPVSHPEVPTSYWHTNPPPQYANNGCIKLPPIQIPNFDGDPLAFHDWYNIFKASVHDNTSISQTHRITYLQNSVSGKAKDLIRGYSCNPAFYSVSLAELESRFGSPQHIVTAYIYRLENWAHISSQNPHTLVSFFTFLKQLVQTFINLQFTADLQSSTVLTIAKQKLPHNLPSNGQNTLSRTTSTHQLCFIFSNGWRFKPKFLKPLIRTLHAQTNHLSRTCDHRLPRK